MPADTASAPQAKAALVAKPQHPVADLNLDLAKYADRTADCDGQQVAYRAYEKITYVKNPAFGDNQQLSIYIPAAYLRGESINGYTAKTAPIFMPNAVGGYMPGGIIDPTRKNFMNGKASTALQALRRGYVVVSPAIRGRSNAIHGNYVGKAPAFIVDYKAAVRYIRHNKSVLPAGDTEKIISSGTSAGGCLSALLGATGNSKDYEPYLKEIGAADERDDIFASQDYCPITNLEHADMAYEWVFNGVNDCHGRMFHMPPRGVPPFAPPGKSAVMSELAQKMSLELKALFPDYVNSLQLKDEKGKALTLDPQGDGTFKKYIESVYMASAQKALDRGDDLGDAAKWLTIKNHQVVSMDLAQYAQWATRMKETPAFDKIDYTSGENDEFATQDNTPRHFTAYSLKNTVGTGTMADAQTIKMMNPMCYIGTKDATVAKHWRIRHGVKDRDTVLAIPAILALKLQNCGYEVDFASPWGLGHAGDYDLDELFDWIDSICKK